MALNQRFRTLTEDSKKHFSLFHLTATMALKKIDLKNKSTLKLNAAFLFFDFQFFLRWYSINTMVQLLLLINKVHIFWGHYIWRNLQILFEITLRRFKKGWRFRHIFVVFSEYMNFNWSCKLHNPLDMTLKIYIIFHYSKSLAERLGLRHLFGKEYILQIHEIQRKISIKQIEC